MGVDTSGSSWHQSNRGVSIYITIYLTLLVLVAYLGKLLHDRHKLSSFLPEAAMVILVGMVAGLAIHLLVSTDSADNADQGDDAFGMADEVAESLLSFSPSVFFIVLLPPIIFNSGYHLRRDLFFRHMGPICLYACLGTAVSTLVVAGFLYSLLPLLSSFQPSFLELLTFGALLSATDPVSTLAVFGQRKADPHLFYLVFGESVINDAVGLVLFDSLAHLVENQMKQGEEMDISNEIFQFLFDFMTGFVGSLFLGLTFGLAYALFFKHSQMQSAPLLELLLYSTAMYFPFVVAEILHLSGIVTVLFTGIALKRYAEPNVTVGTSRNADTIFRLVAHLTETIIFLELGLSVFGLVGQGAFQVGFVLCALGACLVGRASNIYPMTLLFNTSVQNCCSKRDAGKLVNDVEGQTNARSGLTMDESVAMVDDATIPWKTAHMIWFSGLRGAVSYGLVRIFPATANRNVFVATTMVVVLVTTFVLGGSTEWMLRFLKIDTGVDEVEYLKRIGSRRLLTVPLERLEARVLQWAVRDNDESKPNTTSSVATTPVLKDAPVEHDYQEHVELTEEEHIRNVKDKKKASVYDFGQ